MKLENQVCTAEQAKRLNELGVYGESLHKWHKLKFPANEDAFSKHRANCLITETNDNIDRFIMHYIDYEAAQYHWSEGTHDGGQDHSRCEIDDDGYPAFNVAELGAILPNEGYYVYTGYDCKSSIIKFDNKVGFNPKYESVKSAIMETEAQSRAALLIYLLENKLTTPEECNQRFSNS